MHILRLCYQLCRSKESDKLFSIFVCGLSDQSHFFQWFIINWGEVISRLKHPQRFAGFPFPWKTFFQKSYHLGKICPKLSDRVFFGICYLITELFRRLNTYANGIWSAVLVTNAVDLGEVFYYTKNTLNAVDWQHIHQTLIWYSCLFAPFACSLKKFFCLVQHHYLNCFLDIFATFRLAWRWMWDSPPTGCSWRTLMWYRWSCDNRDLKTMPKHYKL